MSSLELAKIEGQELSDFTKRIILKKMLPEDLREDLEKDKSLKTWEEAWKYVLEQVPLRKDWKTSSKKGRNDMDVDMAEKEQETDDGEVVCRPCGGQGGDDELNTMKGGGNGFRKEFYKSRIEGRL